MAMSKQILNKIARDLDQLAISYTRAADGSITVAGWTISYDNASIMAPMGGVDPSNSPYLGIGTANPGQLHIATGATLALSVDSAAKLQVLGLCASFANDVNVVCSDQTVRIRGNVDNLGLGQ